MQTFAAFFSWIGGLATLEKAWAAWNWWIEKRAVFAPIEIKVYIAFEHKGDASEPLRKYIYVMVINRTEIIANVELLLFENSYFRRYIRFPKMPKIEFRKPQLVILPKQKHGWKIDYVPNALITRDKYFGLEINGNKHWVKRSHWKRVQKEYFDDFPESVAPGKLVGRLTFSEYNSKPELGADKNAVE